LNSANGRTVDKPDAFFSSAAGDGIYRPILVRHIVRYNQTHLFAVVFVRTLPRQFLGFAGTSLLLAGLVLASRFRFAYLEEPERVSACFDDSLDAGTFTTSCKQLRYDLEA